MNLSLNTVDPLPVPVSLELVEEGQFKAVTPTGAPFALVLPVSVAGGTIDGDASSVTIPAGAMESETLSVSRTAGTTTAVTVSIGTLPSLPKRHLGYSLSKPDTALEVLPLPAGTAGDTTNTTHQLSIAVVTTPVAETAEDIEFQRDTGPSGDRDGDGRLRDGGRDRAGGCGLHADHWHPDIRGGRDPEDDRSSAARRHRRRGPGDIHDHIEQRRQCRDRRRGSDRHHHQLRPSAEGVARAVRTHCGRAGDRCDRGTTEGGAGSGLVRHIGRTALADRGRLRRCRGPQDIGSAPRDRCEFSRNRTADECLERSYHGRPPLAVPRPAVSSPSEPDNQPSPCPN